MDKIFIFLGPPGCGKGTQTANLSNKLHLPHIDTGSLLRKHVQKETPYGLEAKSYMDKGQLVPARIVADIIKTRILEPDTEHGYILDGYPRSIEQAKLLEDVFKEIGEKKEIVAFYFDIPTDTLVERLVNRRFCPKCGMIYNKKSSPPKIDNCCDICCEKLSKRSDDTEEVAQERFKTYFKETAPLLEFYKEKGILEEIDADKPIDEVWEEIKELADIEPDDSEMDSIRTEE